jgi:hypothetical protein
VRWLVPLGLALLLVFGIYVLREVRGDATPVTRTGAASPTRETPEETSSVPQAGGSVAVKAPVDHPSMLAPSASPSPTRPADAPTTERPPGFVDENDPNDPIFAPVNGEPPSAYRVRVRQGQAALERGNYKGAYKVVKLIIDETPTFVDAYKVAIPALCATGDVSTSASYLGRLTEEEDRKAAIKACADFGIKLEL